MLFTRASPAPVADPIFPGHRTRHIRSHERLEKYHDGGGKFTLEQIEEQYQISVNPEGRVHVKEHDNGDQK